MVKQVQGFLGFGNFYRRFIRGFSEIARPLNKLLKKDRKFEWTTECQQAFNDLKTRFTSEPVLVMPDQTKPFQIECDTSKYASGAVLTQLDSNGDRHLCVFISKTFSPAKRNYEIYDQELLAIIQALEEWRHYIQGSPHTTIVFSDHKNLTYFWGGQKIKPTTSMMVPLPIRVQRQIDSYHRNENSTVGHPFQMTRLHSRRGYR